MYKKLSASVISIVLVILILSVTFLIKSCFTVSDTRSNTIWNEVEISKNTNVAEAVSDDFDLKETVDEADYIFSGQVLDKKEYEVEWTDDNGEQWGPFPSSVIEVKVLNEYSGKSPVDGDIIRVYYPCSLSTKFINSFQIEDSNEYVFITRALDEEFVENRNAQNPYDRFEQEKYADVYISNTAYDLMSVNNGTVSMYKDYVDWSDEYSEKSENITESEITDNPAMELINSECFTQLQQNDFDGFLDEILSNERLLPDGDILTDIYKEESKDEEMQ